MLSVPGGMGLPQLVHVASERTAECSDIGFFLRGGSVT